MIRKLPGAVLCVLAIAGSASAQGSGATPMISDRNATLTGRIITDSGPPRRPWFVVVFPVNRDLWLPRTSRITAALSDAEGTWIARHLPAGDYRLAVVTDLVPGELSDPFFLRKLTPASITVTLAEGERKTQDLRLGSGF